MDGEGEDVKDFSGGNKFSSQVELYKTFSSLCKLRYMILKFFSISNFSCY